MSSQLRPKEEFVINSVATHFLGNWWNGEDPPDAYLQVNNKVTAVEISILTQHVTDGRGGSKPRLSEDSTAIWLANALNDELQDVVPDRVCVLLTLSSPILKARKVKTQLRENIANLVLTSCKSEVSEIILGNRISIHVAENDRPSGTKVVGLITNRNSSSDILMNAWEILEDRIAAKANICRSLSGSKWLALFNDYRLADDDTYQQAIKMFFVDHPFEKILLVSDNGSVTVLYEISGNVNSLPAD